MNKKIAFVPCRSGSSRVPGKNTRPFYGGKSLTDIAIDKLAHSALFDMIVLSTNDKELIQKYSSKYELDDRVIIHRRSDESATIDAPTPICVSEFINWYRNDPKDIICLVQVTCPFWRVPQLELALSKFKPGTLLKTFIPNKSYIWECTDGVFMPQYDTLNKRTTDVVRLSQFEEAGAFWAFETENVHKLQWMCAEGLIIPFILNDMCALDIDYEWEFVAAQAVYARFYGQE